MFAYDNKKAAKTISRKNTTKQSGIPVELKSRVESMSGLSMDDVNVHYNSSKPAQLQALAYTRGTDIHIAPGQEKYLPHEAWHVVQQMQGRVKPTRQKANTAINDDPVLEREADLMGERAAQSETDADFDKTPAILRTPFSNTFQFAKNMGKDMNTIYLSAKTFDLYFRFYFSDNINNESWNIFKGMYCRELGLSGDEDMIKISSEKKKNIINEIRQLDDLCTLYRELARFRFYRPNTKDGHEAVQKCWISEDGQITDNADTFVEKSLYESPKKPSKKSPKKPLNKFGKQELATKYKPLLVNEIESQDYNNFNELQYSYNRDAQTVEGVAPGKTNVLYRAMKPEEYQLLLRYFNNMKAEVDRIYDTRKVDNKENARGEKNIDKINRLFNRNGFSETLLPIAAHVGDFEQAASYLVRRGEPERILVKFYVKDNKRESFINEVTSPSKRGGEGKSFINEDNHADDKIGTKLEENTFSYNLGTSKWAAFKFLYWIDRIEVVNVNAL